MPKLRVDVWSDIACPWCYIGKRRLESALARFDGEVAIAWRSFELDPSAPQRHPADVPHAERLARKYGVTRQKAEAMNAHITELARADGLDFRLDRIQGGNSFDAHRVLHLARERGLQDAVKERFFRGYFTEGEAIGEPDVVARLAADAGLDAEEVRALFASDAYADEVRADEREARELGITGVPFFVLAGKYAVSGAQPSELLLRALEQAKRELPATVAEGAACGPDGCD